LASVLSLDYEAPFVEFGIDRFIMTRFQSPDIDFVYWIQKSPFFQNLPLLQNIKIGLYFADKGRLIDDVISKIDRMTNCELVEIIKNEIENVSSKSCHADEEILRIFDLIQGWGGRMGRGPYVKPKTAPYRMSNSTQIAFLYRANLKYLREGSLDKALQELLKIKYLGESFATKHLYFWGKYGTNKKILPIYDTRIKLLVYSSDKRAPSYSQYVFDLTQKANEIGLDIEELEKALFAFSSNWFANNNLKIIEKPRDAKDRVEAERIAKAYERNKRLLQGECQPMQ